MRQEKSLLLQEIKDKIADSKAIVFVSYKQMGPNLSSNFRTIIGKSGGGFEVVKKRMLIKAAENMGFRLEKETLEGHIGMVLAMEDPVQTTKSVYDFCKENESVLDIIGGRFEGVVCSAKDVELISALPGKDEMRAQLLGLFEAPMSQTLAVMESLLCSVMFCLQNKTADSEEKSN